MDRNYLAGRVGDAANAVLAAAGYNFRLSLAWFRRLWRAWFGQSLDQPCRADWPPGRGLADLRWCTSGFFTDD